MTKENLIERLREGIGEKPLEMSDDDIITYCLENPRPDGWAYKDPNTGEDVYVHGSVGYIRQKEQQQKSMIKSTLYPALAVVSTLLLGALVLRLGPIERNAKLRYECARFEAMLDDGSSYGGKLWYEGRSNRNKLVKKGILKQLQKINRISNLPWKLKTMTGSGSTDRMCTEFFKKQD